MKSVLVALLLITIILFAAVESHKRGSKRGSGKRKGRLGGYGIKPWTKRRDKQECPKNCSLCEDGVCKECQPKYFSVQTRFLRRTICVPCGRFLRRAWPDVFMKQCIPDGCGKGCANCSSPGLCTKCDEDWKLFTPPNANVTICVRKCPPRYERVKDWPSPRCQLKPKSENSTCGSFCEKCSEEGVCLKCKAPKRRIRLGQRVKCMFRCPLPFKERYERNGKTTTLLCEKKQRTKVTLKGGKTPTLSDAF